MLKKNSGHFFGEIERYKRLNLVRIKKGDLMTWKEIIKEGKYEALRNWLREAKQGSAGMNTIGVHSSEGEAYRQFDELYNNDKEYLNSMIRPVFGASDVGSDLKGVKGHYYITLR